MGNVMADFGNNESVNFYVGAGLGMAMVRHKLEPDEDGDFDIKDSNLAWQIIAGVRAPVFRHFDVGVKYRYFNGGRVSRLYYSVTYLNPHTIRFSDPFFQIILNRR